MAKKTLASLLSSGKSNRKPAVPAPEVASESARPPPRAAKSKAHEAWKPLERKRKVSQTSTASRRDSVNTEKNLNAPGILEGLLALGRKKAKTANEPPKKTSFKAPSMEGPEAEDPKPAKKQANSLLEDMQDRVAAMKTKAAARAAQEEEESGDEEGNPAVIDDSDDDDMPEAHLIGQKERAAAVAAKDLSDEGAVVVEKAVSHKSSRKSMRVDDSDSDHDVGDDDNNDRHARAFADYRSKASSKSSVDLTANFIDEDEDYDEGQEPSGPADLSDAQILDIFAQHSMDVDGDDITDAMRAALLEAVNEHAAAHVQHQDETPQVSRRKVPKLGDPALLQREYAEFPANDEPGPIYRRVSTKSTRTTIEDIPDEENIPVGGHVERKWLARTDIITEKIGSRIVMGKKTQTKLIERLIGGSIEYSIRIFLGQVDEFPPMPFSSGGLEGIAFEALLITASLYNLDTCDKDVCERLRADEDYAVPLVNYVVQRLISYRSSFKDVASTVVPVELNLKKTDAGRARAKEILDDHSYHCGVNMDLGVDFAKPYRADVVQRMVSATLAKNTGSSPLYKYGNGFTSTFHDGPRALEREVPILMLVLVLTAIHAVLMEWSRNSKDHFSGNNVEGAFKSHMAMLEALKERKPVYFHKLMHELFQGATGAQAVATHGLSNEEIIAATRWDDIADEED